MAEVNDYLLVNFQFFCLGFRYTPSAIECWLTLVSLAQISVCRIGGPELQRGISQCRLTVAGSSSDGKATVSLHEEMNALKISSFLNCSLRSE
jgi:hypothetical protein